MHEKIAVYSFLNSEGKVFEFVFGFHYLDFNILGKMKKKTQNAINYNTSNLKIPQSTIKIRINHKYSSPQKCPWKTCHSFNLNQKLVKVLKISPNENRLSITIIRSIIYKKISIFKQRESKIFVFYQPQ